MFGLLDGLKIGGGVALGVAACLTINAVWWLPAAKEEARAIERATMQVATDNAVGELTDEADKARVRRRLCIERGLVYSNHTGQCFEGPGIPRG